MKARHRERLALAGSLVLATLLFELWPEADAHISALFFDGQGFLGEQWAPVRWMYRAVPWLGALLFCAALVLWLRAARAGVDVARWRWRRASALVLAMVLGLGGVVHVALKDSWGRPRPDQAQRFGGSLPFVPALHPSVLCERNCSFVSGHAAAGFSLLALGVFGCRRTRRRWWAAAMLAGGLIGLGRVAQGRHYASDIVFCALVMWCVTALLREAWLRVLAWRRARRAAAHADRLRGVMELS